MTDDEAFWQKMRQQVLDEARGLPLIDAEVRIWAWNRGHGRKHKIDSMESLNYDSSGELDDARDRVFRLFQDANAIAVAIFAHDPELEGKNADFRATNPGFSEKSYSTAIGKAMTDNR